MSIYVGIINWWELLKSFLKESSLLSARVANSKENITTVKAAASVTEEQFSNWYNTYVERIHTYVFYRVNNHTELAEDITAETFVRLYEKADHYELTDDSVLPLLYTIARNLCYDHFRKTPTIDLEKVVVSSKQTSHDDMVDAQLLWQYVATLSPEQQEILQLRYLEGLPHADIAKIIGKSPSAIRTALSRAIDKLQAHYVES